MLQRDGGTRAADGGRLRMNAVIGQPVSRVDGPAKVTGRAHYAAEFDLPRLAYARAGHEHHRARAHRRHRHGGGGTVTRRARRHHPRERREVALQRDGAAPGGRLRNRAISSGCSRTEILFSGQPIAVVVAETLEQAEGAAALVRSTYAGRPGRTEFDVAAARPPSDATSKSGRPGEKARGDAKAAFDAAEVRIDTRYVQPREHHNAMEPHATIAQLGRRHADAVRQVAMGGQRARRDRACVRHVRRTRSTSSRTMSAARSARRCAPGRT